MWLTLWVPELCWIIQERHMWVQIQVCHMWRWFVRSWICTFTKIELFVYLENDCQAVKRLRILNSLFNQQNPVWSQMFQVFNLRWTRRDVFIHINSFTKNHQNREESNDPSGECGSIQVLLALHTWGVYEGHHVWSSVVCKLSICTCIYGCSSHVTLVLPPLYRNISNVEHSIRECASPQSTSSKDSIPILLQLM